jgi:hypothetical protein
MHVLRLANQQTASMDKLYFYFLQTDWILLKRLPDCKKKSKELLRDSSLGQVMTSCDADIDWGSNKEVIVDTDKDVGDKGEGWQESDDNDSSLERDYEEVDTNNDDTVYDSTYPAQVSFCASLIVNYLNVLISFINTKVTLKLPSTREMD